MFEGGGMLDLKSGAFCVGGLFPWVVGIPVVGMFRVGSMMSVSWLLGCWVGSSHVVGSSSPVASWVL